MKKSLLFVCLALTTTTFAQFTNSNSPQVGNGATMYVLDTNVTNYAAITGTGVTWDYSTTLGVYGEVKAVGVTTPTDPDFTGSTISIDIPGFMTAFNKSTASDYTSQGFIFETNDPTIGSVKAMFNVDDESLMSYPATVGGSWTDAVAGEVSATPGTFNCTGTASTTVDGSGTLMLNSTTTLTGVLRFKIRDSLYVDAGFPIGDVYMKRTQYEYYHHTTSSLPVFVHSTIDLEVFGAVNTLGIVMSAFEPDGYMAVKSEELTGVSVFPNPATDVLNFNGLTEDATIQIYSLNGQLIKTVELAIGTSKVSLDDLTAGAYIVKATTANGTLTSKISVK